MATKPPLVVRWHALELAPVQAGAAQVATVELENEGGARWRTRGREDGLFLSYHWLDERGNPILWDGVRTSLEREIEPGERVTHALRVRGPIPPGSYRLAVDLVEEWRFWLADLGNAPLERAVDVAPRDASDARTFFADDAEADEQWHQVVRALHEEGYSAVGGAVVVESGRFRKVDAELAPYAPGGGRNPVFREPLVCPSLLPPLEPNAEVAGLPAWRPEPGNEEPWMFDGRAAVRLRSRSGRRRA